MNSCIRIVVLVLAPAIASTGCTALSLERHTLNQIHSVADYRYREVMHCLAVVAHDPGALPPYGLLSAGTTRIADMETASSATQWSRAVQGFASETLALTLNRSPTESWTIIPVADYQQLEALRCACRWVTIGPERACSSCPGLLSSPEQDHSPGIHFGVADRLARLPVGWLHVGCHKDVPAGCCYKAHCGDTWVWVMPDGMVGLSDFTLVLQDIATLDTGTYVPPQLLITLKWTLPPCAAPTSGEQEKLGIKDIVGTPICTETRVIKPEYAATVASILFSRTPVDLRKVPWEVYTTPYPGQRTNAGPTGTIAAAALRSVVAAGGPYPGVSPPPAGGPYPGVSPPPGVGRYPGVSPPPR
jgi:hypothetical protein